MTSLALLKNLDGSNQNHISCHYIADQFFRCDFNNIRFDSKNKKTGMPYSHFIRICGPVFCC
jgi:hypothetical protein